MPRFLPTQDKRVVINIDRIRCFSFVELPDRKWATAARFDGNHVVNVATHDTLDDARDALATLLDRNGVLGG
jgi:hypothetical protein